MIMKYYDMTPVQKPYTNGLLHGRPAQEHETSVIGGEVHGMPVTRTDGNQQIVSVWKCKSLWWRLRFLFKGEVTLTVLGNKHPALSISVGETLEA